MRLYEFQFFPAGRNNYGGGLALIAASSYQQAIKLSLSDLTHYDLGSWVYIKTVHQSRLPDMKHSRVVSVFTYIE